MKVLRALLAGVAVTVFDFVLGMVTCGWLFNWVYKEEPTNVWKQMDSPPGPEYYVGALVLNLLFVGVYLLLRRGIPGANVYVKGLVFGLCVWAVSTLPGMFATYEFMTVAPVVVVYWTVMALINLPLKGLIVAAICARE